MTQGSQATNIKDPSCSKCGNEFPVRIPRTAMQKAFSWLNNIRHYKCLKCGYKFTQAL